MAEWGQAKWAPNSHTEIGTLQAPDIGIESISVLDTQWYYGDPCAARQVGGALAGRLKVLGPASGTFGCHTQDLAAPKSVECRSQGPAINLAALDKDGSRKRQERAKKRICAPFVGGKYSNNLERHD